MGPYQDQALTPKLLHPVKPHWREAIVKDSSLNIMPDMLTLRGQRSRKPMVNLRAKRPWNFVFLSCCSHCTSFLVGSPLACSALLSTQVGLAWALNKWGSCYSLNYHDKKVKKSGMAHLKPPPCSAMESLIPVAVISQGIPVIPSGQGHFAGRNWSLLAYDEPLPQSADLIILIEFIEFSLSNIYVYLPMQYD